MRWWARASNGQRNTNHGFVYLTLEIICLQLQFAGWNVRQAEAAPRQAGDASQQCERGLSHQGCHPVAQNFRRKTRHLTLCGLQSPLPTACAYERYWTRMSVGEGAEQQQGRQGNHRCLLFEAPLLLCIGVKHGRRTHCDVGSISGWYGGACLICKQSRPSEAHCQQRRILASHFYAPRRKSLAI